MMVCFTSTFYILLWTWFLPLPARLALDGVPQTSSQWAGPLLWRLAIWCEASFTSLDGTPSRRLALSLLDHHLHFPAWAQGQVMPWIRRNRLSWHQRKVNALRKGRNQQVSFHQC